MMSEPIELIIFDCDGVLIDSEHIACAIEAQALIDIGCAIDLEEAIQSFTGRPDAEVYAEVERRFGLKIPEDHDERVTAFVKEGFRQGLKATEGIHQALAEIDLPVCVASSSSISRLEFTLGLADLYEKFSPHIFSAQMVKRGKPAPDIFLYAAAEMGIKPTNCLVIEDSSAGVKAGKDAGMRIWGFAGGSHCRAGHAERLLSEGAEMVFNDMALLPALLRENEWTS